MTSTKLRIFTIGVLLIFISTISLFTARPVAESLGMDWIDECGPDDGEECSDGFGELPTGQAWIIILGTLGMCLLGIVLVMVSISMMITGDGDTTSTGALFIPGESDDTPASDVQETSQPNTAPQSPPDNQSNRRATLWGLALVFIPIALYLIFMNTGGFGSYCNDDHYDRNDDTKTWCLRETPPAWGIYCLASITIPIGILVLMQTAIKSIQLFRHNR